MNLHRTRVPAHKMNTSGIKKRYLNNRPLLPNGRLNEWPPKHE